MWGNLGPELTPVVTVVSGVLVVVVLIVALSLRNKIKRTERGNEFLIWGKEEEEDQINEDLLGEEINDLEENDEEDETE